MRFARNVQDMPTPRTNKGTAFIVFDTAPALKRIITLMSIGCGNKLEMSEENMLRLAAIYGATLWRAARQIAVDSNL